MERNYEKRSEIKDDQFIFKVESTSCRIERITDYFLRIYDFDGNLLFSTSIWERPHERPHYQGWIGGFFDLKVDIRMGSKTLFYRMGQQSLIIMNLDTLMKTYIEGGKETIREYIHCI